LGAITQIKQHQINKYNVQISKILETSLQNVFGKKKIKKNKNKNKK